MTESLRLHHAGVALAEIASAAERYRLRFGYQLATTILHDPLQTAFVQFLRLPGEQTYLELVAPDGPAGKLSNAVRRGGGLHHLCYTAGSLEAAIAQLERAEMKLISDPKPAVALGGRRICWLLGSDGLLLELVERREEDDLCVPGL